jgi:hypothetical protein
MMGVLAGGAGRAMKRTEKSVSGSGFRDCSVSRVNSARPVVADRAHQDDDPLVGGAVASFLAVCGRWRRCRASRGHRRMLSETG